MLMLIGQDRVISLFISRSLSLFLFFFLHRFDPIVDQRFHLYIEINLVTMCSVADCHCETIQNVLCTGVRSKN